MDDFLNNKGKSSTPTGNSLTPSPRQGANGSAQFGEGSSIAVLQFVALMRGEWGVQAPRSPFRVERVRAEERYCLGCCGVRWHDVVEGQRPAFGFQRLAICRCCGKECAG